MITVTTTQVRPSAIVPFYLETESVSSASLAELINITANRNAPPVITLSPDQLTHTVVATFTGQPQLDAFLVEVEAVLPDFFAQRSAFCSAHGIVLTRTAIETF